MLFMILLVLLSAVITNFRGDKVSLLILLEGNQSMSSQ